jgi:hypothetical protein
MGVVVGFAISTVMRELVIHPVSFLGNVIFMIQNLLMKSARRFPPMSADPG